MQFTVFGYTLTSEMRPILAFFLVLLLCPCFSSKTHNANVVLTNTVSNESLKTPEVFHTNDFSWARGNQSCPQLLQECLQYLQIIPRYSEQFVRPALGLGLVQVGCLSETDLFHLDLLRDEHTREMFRLLSTQWNSSVQHTATHLFSPKQNRLDTEVLRFNLDSLAPAYLSKRPKHCSGFWQEKQAVQMNGLDLGIHHSLPEAKVHCDKLSSSCAGVSMDRLGRFHTVARNGGNIIPLKGARLWLHRCFSDHARRRSVPSECENEKERNIHKVIQWVPLVSGWYNAGSAVFYATKGCSEQAEDRAVEASLDLGYDALLAATGGASGAVGLSLGVAMKPALKAGMKAAIEYFKQAKS